MKSNTSMMQPGKGGKFKLSNFKTRNFLTPQKGRFVASILLWRKKLTCRWIYHSHFKANELNHTLRILETEEHFWGRSNFWRAVKSFKRSAAMFLAFLPPVSSFFPPSNMIVCFECSEWLWLVTYHSHLKVEDNFEGNFYSPLLFRHYFAPQEWASG